MIIDFHTHIFPDALAPKALHALNASSGGMYPMESDGTAAGLLRNMDRWHVDVSVIQPVVTNQSQMQKANEWAARMCSDRLVGFGGIYPHTDDYKRDIDYVISLGLRGLKFHAEFQDFTVDDARMLKIYDYAMGKGLILMHHAGFDPSFKPSFKPPFKSSPRRFARVAQAMGGGVLIVAHLGGHAQWDEVEDVLAGSSVYLDTSMGFGYFPKGQFLRILKKHGADKVLFGSDSPWGRAQAEMDHLKSLPLSADDLNGILGGNAKRLLAL